MAFNNRGGDTANVPLPPNVRVAHGTNSLPYVSNYTLPPVPMYAQISARNPNVFNTPYASLGTTQSIGPIPRVGQTYDWFRAPSKRDSRTKANYDTFYRT